MALAIVAAAAGCAPAMAATVPSIDIPGLVGDDPLREGFVSGFILIFFSGALGSRPPPGVGRAWWGWDGQPLPCVRVYAPLSRQQAPLRLTELGDKTFFIALLLALQAKKEAVFAGTFGALAVMTVISVALGVALHEVDEVRSEDERGWTR